MRWCCPPEQPCSGVANYAGFWRGGGGSGTISFALPTGYNKGRLHLGMYENFAGCHGLVTVGGETIFDELQLVADRYVEFDYANGDVLSITEEGTCIVPSPVNIYVISVHQFAPDSGSIYDTCIERSR